jgi:integrase
MAKVTKEITKTGLVRYKADWLTPEGERKRRYFERKKDADDHVAQVKVTKKEKRYHDVFDVKKEYLTTFNELAAEYEKNFGAQKAFKTSKKYLLKIVKTHFGDKRLSEITYKDLETYRNKRKATPAQGGSPRTDASVNREMALIGHMLNKAVEWEMLGASPFKKGKRLMFKENNQRQRYLTDGEIESLLVACEDLKTYSPHLKPLVQLALSTGMRRGELLSLKWEQIRHGLIYLRETKANKGRQIPLNADAEAILAGLRRKKHLTTDFVFSDSKGRRFYDVKRSFTSACRRAALEDTHFHDLRHTFASHLVMNGVSLKAVQELLGHADLKMTMRYAHLSKGHLQEAVAAVNGLAKSGAGKTDSFMTPAAPKIKRAANLSIATP